MILYHGRLEDYAVDAALKMMRERMEPRHFLLVQSPHYAGFARFDPFGKLEAPNGPIEHRTLFDIRGFDGQCEWRWRLRDGHVGGLVVISENESFAANETGWIRTSTKVELASDLRYRVWGRTDGSSAKNGWARCLEARLGAVAVPWSGEVPKEFALWAREYFVVEAFGNVVVGDERLVGVEGVV